MALLTVLVSIVDLAVSRDIGVYTFRRIGKPTPRLTTKRINDARAAKTIRIISLDIGKGILNIDFHK